MQLALGHKGIEYEKVQNGALVSINSEDENQVALEVDGKVLSNCHAIVEYLDEAYPEKSNLLP